QLLVAAAQAKLLPQPAEHLAGAEGAALELVLEVGLEEVLDDLPGRNARRGEGGELLGGLVPAEVAQDVAEIEDNGADAHETHPPGDEPDFHRLVYEPASRPPAPHSQDRRPLPA